MSRSVQNPKTLTPLINMITPKVQFINAKYWLVIAAVLTGGMIYLGNSNHRVADTNDALSADINLLIEYMMPREPQGGGSLSNMPIIGSADAYIIWGQPARTERR